MPMSIYDHISIKFKDDAGAIAFYKAALAPLGIELKFLVERPGGHMAGYGREKVQLFIGNGAAPVSGQLHLAFQARGRGEVDGFHAAGLAAGGQNNGQPGVRPQYHDNYYAAFVFDPAGNNVEAVYQGEP
jgi:catechol 2,3-dioxygenase-like lactoylglutathione lyase family enzyme